MREGINTGNVSQHVEKKERSTVNLNHSGKSNAHKDGIYTIQRMHREINNILLGKCYTILLLCMQA